MKGTPSSGSALSAIIPLCIRGEIILKKPDSTEFAATVAAGSGNGGNGDRSSQRSLLNRIMSGLAVSFAPDPTPADATESPQNGKAHQNGNGNGKSRHNGNGQAPYSSEDEANFTGELLATDLMLLADLAPELDEDLAFLATLELDEEAASFPELEAVVEAELDEAVSILDLQAEAEAETHEEPMAAAAADTVEESASVVEADRVEESASVVEADTVEEPPSVADDDAVPRLFTPDPEASDIQTSEAEPPSAEAPETELALTNGPTAIEATFLATLFTDHHSDETPETTVEEPAEVQSAAITAVRPQRQPDTPAPPRNRRWRLKTPLAGVALLILMTAALAGVVSLRSLDYQPRRSAPAQAIAPPVASDPGSILTAEPPAVPKARDCSANPAHTAKCGNGGNLGAGVSGVPSTPATAHIVRQSNRPHRNTHLPGGSGGSGGGQPQPGTGGGSGGTPTPDESSGKPGCGNAQANGWDHQAKEHSHPDHACPSKKTEAVVTGRMA